jgi:hypothetical protein
VKLQILPEQKTTWRAHETDNSSCVQQAADNFNVTQSAGPKESGSSEYTYFSLHLLLLDTREETGKTTGYTEQKAATLKLLKITQPFTVGDAKLYKRTTELHWCNEIKQMRLNNKLGTIQTLTTRKLTFSAA